LVRILWYFISLTIIESGWFPVYGLKRWLLRRFGAQIGEGVVIKPRVRIKYPWRLEVGDHTWIGEEVWVDNLADVHIGRDVCVSQGVYFCTGSHDARKVSFDLITAPISVAEETWIGTKAIILPGVSIPPGVVVAAGSVVTKSQEISPGVVLAGVPARVIGGRLDDAGYNE